ncbi:MAG: GNAT family N-acetyltransferase [Oligoflexia bacterium]|nr:GNAT family N-acetyltransferase [Oligoflexia bacterium]
MDLRIELLQHEDQPAIDFCSQYLSNTWEISLQEAHERLVSYALGKDKAFCVIAKIDGLAVGMMTLFPRTRLTTDGVYEPWSAGLFVTEQWRSRGIGRRILEEIIAEAKRRGFPKIHLGTDQDHLKRWYISLGWTPVGRAFDGDHEYEVFQYHLGG